MTSHPDRVIVQLLFYFHSLYTLHDIPVYASPLSISGIFLRKSHRWFQGLDKDDLQRRVEVYAFMISCLPWSGWLTFRADIILATCDVEGNFLVVKVRSLAQLFLSAELPT